MGKLVVGYDRAFVGQFFRRSIDTVAPKGIFRDKDVIKLPENEREREYVVDQLVSTTLFPFDERFGSPWSTMPVKKLGKYLKLSGQEVADDDLLIEAKKVADKILIVEGVIRFGGIQNMTMEASKGIKKFQYVNLGCRLYSKSANCKKLNEKERQVLRGMSFHLPIWVNVLSRIKGMDALELMTQNNIGRFS